MVNPPAFISSPGQRKPGAFVACDTLYQKGNCKRQRSPTSYSPCTACIFLFVMSNKKSGCHHFITSCSERVVQQALPSDSVLITFGERHSMLTKQNSYLTKYVFNSREEQSSFVCSILSHSCALAQVEYCTMR